MNKNSLLCFFALLAIASAATYTTTTTTNYGNVDFSINIFANWNSFELYLLAAGLIVLGLVNLLFGLKYAKIIIFLMGFAMSACSAYGIEYATNKDAAVLTVILISLISGVIGGCVFYFCYHCSIFTIGFVLGAGIVFTGFAFAGLTEGNAFITMILSIAAGIVAGIVALKVHDIVLIISTSFAGAAYVTWAICIFVANKDFYTVYQTGYIYRLISLALAIGGIIYQFKNKSINQDDLQRGSINSPDVYALDMNGHEAYNPYTGRKF
jgi:hypothetical protein